MRGLIKSRARRLFRSKPNLGPAQVEQQLRQHQAESLQREVEKEQSREAREWDLARRMDQLVTEELLDYAQIPIELDGKRYRLMGPKAMAEHRLGLDRSLSYRYEDTSSRGPQLQRWKGSDTFEETDPEDQEYGWSSGVVRWYQAGRDPQLHTEAKELLLLHGPQLLKQIREWNQTPAGQQARELKERKEAEEVERQQRYAEMREREERERRARVRKTANFLAKESHERI